MNHEDSREKQIFWRTKQIFCDCKDKCFVSLKKGQDLLEFILRFDESESGQKKIDADSQKKDHPS